ncbi:PREDICTED: uncharacterized protein LOC108361314 [Rhagoletis zephyria]|uniref:uncharacterized protein LOC108361314 n=1 Tax=Rhagoletis zephyria TaxID=28612 RepID=UPI000811815A|nr:PREDICTED: uncharacterized protein LOC108361314 [Rhagoletis zephyria]
MPRESEKNKLIAELCVNQVIDMIFADSSDEEEQDEADERFMMNMLSLLCNRRSIHLGIPKSAVWHRRVLNSFDDRRFNQMVRVRPEEFGYILNLIKDADVFKTVSHTSQLPIALQLQIVLYGLGSSGDGVSIRKVASLFGVGDGGTIQNVT